MTTSIMRQRLVFSGPDRTFLQNVDLDAGEDADAACHLRASTARMLRGHAACARSSSRPLVIARFFE